MNGTIKVHQVKMMVSKFKFKPEVTLSYSITLVNDNKAAHVLSRHMTKSQMETQVEIFCRLLGWPVEYFEEVHTTDCSIVKIDKP
jgi:hypothetical protein